MESVKRAGQAVTLQLSVNIAVIAIPVVMELMVALSYIGAKIVAVSSEITIMHLVEEYLKLVLIMLLNSDETVRV